MRRKAIAVLLVLVLVSTALSAAPFFQIGPLASYNKTVVEIDDDKESWGINNFSFGADVRLTPFKYFSIDIPATLGFGSQGSFSIAAIPTLNINIPLGNIVDIAVGAGTQFDFQYAGGESKDWTMNGLPLENAADAFQHSKLVYRLGVTFNLAFLSIGANAVLPGSAGFGDGDIGGIFTPMWESTRFSLVALFNIG